MKMWLKPSEYRISRILFIVFCTFNTTRAADGNSSTDPLITILIFGIVLVGIIFCICWKKIRSSNRSGEEEDSEESINAADFSYQSSMYDLYPNGGSISKKDSYNQFQPDSVFGTASGEILRAKFGDSDTLWERMRKHKEKLIESTKNPGSESDGPDISPGMFADQSYQDDIGMKKNILELKKNDLCSSRDIILKSNFSVCSYYSEIPDRYLQPTTDEFKSVTQTSLTMGLSRTTKSQDYDRQSDSNMSIQISKNSPNDGFDGFSVMAKGSGALDEESVLLDDGTSVVFAQDTNQTIESSDQGTPRNIRQSPRLFLVARRSLEEIMSAHQVKETSRFNIPEIEEENGCHEEDDEESHQSRSVDPRTSSDAVEPFHNDDGNLHRPEDDISIQDL